MRFRCGPDASGEDLVSDNDVMPGVALACDRKNRSRAGTHHEQYAKKQRKGGHTQKCPTCGLFAPCWSWGCREKGHHYFLVSSTTAGSAELAALPDNQTSHQGSRLAHSTIQYTVLQDSFGWLRNIDEGK